MESKRNVLLHLYRLSLFPSCIAVLSRMKKEVHGTTTKRTSTRVPALGTNPDGLMRMTDKSTMSQKTHIVDHRHDKNMILIVAKQLMPQLQLVLVIHLYSHKVRATILMVQVKMKHPRKKEDLTTDTHRIMTLLQLDLATLLYSLATRPCNLVRRATTIMDLVNMTHRRRRPDQVMSHHQLALATRP
jgi:hypothetical protein